MDVAILGGGIVGKALFAALKQARYPLPVSGILIDREPAAATATHSREAGGNLRDESDLNGYSNRVSSINVSQLPFLQSLGIDLGVRGSSLEAQGYSQILLWYADHQEAAVRLGNGKHPLAWIVENRRLSSALDDCIARCEAPGWTVLHGAEASLADAAYDPKAPGTKLKVNGQELSASLLVGADGRRGPVAAWAGIEQVGRDYGQHAIVATVRLGGRLPEEAACAYQRFLPTGPVAFLPLRPSRGVYSLVWSLPSQLALGLLRGQQPDWRRLLEATLRHRWADCLYWTMQQAGLRGRVELPGIPPADIPPDLDLASDMQWRQASWADDWWAWQAQLPEVEEVASVAAFPLTTQLATRLIKPGVALIG